MKKALFAVLLIVSAIGLMPAEGSVEAASEPETAVVASTGWTAAFIDAAGYRGDVHVLAPYELRHPPEYELKPSDVQAVAHADIIVYAGYERMVARIKEATRNNEAAVIQIATDYSLPVLVKSITALGEAFGTQNAAEKNLAELRDLLHDWKTDIARAGASGWNVICHLFQKPLAEELGFSVIGVFGPGPIEASQLNNLSNLQADLIIDNLHNDVGKPLLEIKEDVPVVTFINFPGHAGTKSLSDVLDFNREEFRKILQ